MARPKLSSWVVKDDLFYRCEFVTDGRIHRTAFYSQLPNMAIPTGDRCLNKMVFVFSVTRQPRIVGSNLANGRHLQSSWRRNYCVNCLFDSWVQGKYWVDGKVLVASRYVKYTSISIFFFWRLWRETCIDVSCIRVVLLSTCLHNNMDFWSSSIICFLNDTFA